MKEKWKKEREKKKLKGNIPGNGMTHMKKRMQMKSKDNLNGEIQKLERETKQEIMKYNKKHKEADKARVKE